MPQILFLLLFTILYFSWPSVYGTPDPDDSLSIPNLESLPQENFSIIDGWFKTPHLKRQLTVSVASILTINLLLTIFDQKHTLSTIYAQNRYSQTQMNLLFIDRLLIFWVFNLLTLEAESIYGYTQSKWYDRDISIYQLTYSPTADHNPWIASLSSLFASSEWAFLTNLLDLTLDFATLQSLAWMKKLNHNRPMN